MPPEEVVAEKQTLLSKLHSFDKKEEIVTKEKTVKFDEKKVEIIEAPPPPPPQKVEVKFTVDSLE